MLKKLTPMVWFAILALVTSGLALGLPPDPHTLHQLHISSFAYRIAILGLLIPYGVIWYMAFYAYAKLKEYARTIKGFDDGKAFRYIMIGMGILAFGLVLPMSISLVLGTIAAHHQGFKAAAVIIDNYMGLAVALAAFLSLNNGSHLLAKLSKNHLGLGEQRMLAFLFISLAAAFTCLVIDYHTNHHNVYYLNTPMLVITFIIPQLYTWFLAILCAYEIGLYAKFAKGVLYRKALRQFSNGIMIAIAGSIANQFVDNTFAARVSKSLGSLLLVIYILLVIIAIGLIQMALGSKKLKMIEEA